MTIKQLIKKLKKYDPSMEVYYRSWYDSYRGVKVRKLRIDGKNTIEIRCG